MPTMLVYICHPARRKADIDFQKKISIAFGKRIDRRRDDQKTVPIRFRASVIGEVVEEPEGRIVVT
jgi:hypothetical protein